MRLITATLIAAGLYLATLLPVFASNPHCNGNSDNIHLPNHHTSQNHPACD